MQNRLVDTSTLVVAEPGIPNEAVEDTVGSLFRDAGSAVEGIVWLESSWSLEDEEDRRRFEEIAGESGRSVEQLQQAVVTAILAEVARRGPRTTQPPADDGVAGADGDTGADTVAFFDSALLAELQEAGFVRLVPLGGGDAVPSGARANVVAVTGSASRLEVPGSAAADVAEAAGALQLPTVLAEVHEPTDEQERGELVMRAGEVASAPFSTVDDLDLEAGRVATVLALQQGGEGVFGRYGYGSGVDGVLPPWPGQ